MKRISIIFCLFLLAALACNIGVPVPETPIVAPPDDPATEVVPPLDPPTPTTEPLTGLPRTCADINLTLPEDLAADIECLIVPPASGDEIMPWEITPGHTEIGLTNYILGEKFHRPRLYVFPVVGITALKPYAAENITRIQTILAAPGMTITRQDLPGIHLFNAGGVFASNISRVNFQNGSGVRTLTVYAQYFAPINNYDLFYHFQGLTANGQYYIIAILPVTHPGLQADSMESSAPSDPAFPFYPGFTATTSETIMETYYLTMGNLLDTSSPGAFAPTLSALDALIGSIKVGP